MIAISVRVDGFGSFRVFLRASYPFPWRFPWLGFDTFPRPSDLRWRVFAGPVELRRYAA